MTKPVTQVASSAASVAPSPKKKLMMGVVVIAVAAMIAVAAWFVLKPSDTNVGLVSGNGRIEATEINISTKLAGRVLAIMVNEGDFVKEGQLLAQMQIDVLDAQREEARAQYQQAVAMVSSAEAQVAVRKSDMIAAQALVAQRESELDAAQRRFVRTKALVEEEVVSIQQFDDDRARANGAAAAVAAAQAQVATTQAAISAAESELNNAKSGVVAAEAAITRIEADIADSQLTAPCDGRIQYRVAQPGEVMAAGGKILNMVDLSDVYMTFFLPETVVGQVALGSEVHIVLDAAPQYVIPARVSYVASVAQFTPKTVETTSERQKLMFRVKAQISPDLLLEHLEQVKTGLPGVAWLKLDPDMQWPADLEVKIPE